MRGYASPGDLLSARVMVAMAAILLAGCALSWLARRLGQPAVIGEITAGIALGPSLLGLLPGDPAAALFPATVRPVLSAISQLGLLLFLFLIGWEFTTNVRRPHRTTAGLISLSSVLVAFALGAAVAFVLYPGHSRVHGDTVGRTGFVLFIGAAMAITAFPVLARILADSGLRHTRVGALALASAALDDVMAWCIMAFVSATVTAADSGTGHLLPILLLSAGYLAFILVLVRPLLSRVVARRSGPDRAVYLLPVLVAGTLLSSYATTWIGIHAIFGAFVFGVIMPSATASGSNDAAAVRPALEGVCAVTLPVFFVVTGLNVDISALNPRNYLELAAILLVACAGKFGGACLPARLSGLPWREVAVLGVLMTTRGLTELIILNIGVELGVLDAQMFSMMVVMALFTTGLAGPLLSRLAPEPESARDPVLAGVR